MYKLNCIVLDMSVKERLGDRWTNNLDIVMHRRAGNLLRVLLVALKIKV